MEKDSKGGSLKDGLSEKSAIEQKKPREDGQGQRPKSKSEGVKSDRGSFSIKC